MTSLARKRTFWRNVGQLLGILFILLQVLGYFFSDPLPLVKALTESEKVLDDIGNQSRDSVRWHSSIGLIGREFTFVVRRPSETGEDQNLVLTLHKRFHFLPWTLKEWTLQGPVPKKFRPKDNDSHKASV